MSADIELNWEWPADRTIEDKLLVQITSIEKQGSGLFGISKSPSLVASLPDPFIINGRVINTDSKLNGKSLSIVVPKLEIEAIKPGTYAMFGLVENTTCICIVPVNNKNTDLDNINCP